MVRIPKNVHAMSIKSTNKNKTNIGRKQGENDRPMSEVSIVNTSDRLTEEYLGRHKE